MKKIKAIYQLLIFVFYFGFSLYLQKDTIQEFPHHIHAWAHTDHYALSKGFIQNDFDFFHPETLTSNKQFPSSKHPDQLSRITSSDFPVVQYAAALLMKISGNEEPVVYRMLMLFLACLGLLYLFKIAFYITDHPAFSLLLPILLLFSPVYLDYQIGFLPTMAAMTFLFMGSYFYLVFNDHSKQNYLIYAILCLSIATAVRTPFAILMIAILGHQILLLLRKKGQTKHLLIIVIGFVLPVAYFFYNQHLRAEYGSIFLGTPLYARNLEELISNFTEACQNWHLHYFGMMQWSLISLSLFGLLAVKYLSRDMTPRVNRLTNLGLIYGVGVLTYLVLMSRQMVHHDYYALDTFIPYLTLVSLVAISLFVKNNNIPYFGSVLVLTLILFTLPNNLDTLSSRRSPNYSKPYTQMYEEYSQLSTILENNGISKENELLVLDPFAPNMPFVLSGFKGANVMKISPENAMDILNWHYDYFILRSEWFYRDIWNINPILIQNTQVIAFSNGIFLLEKRKALGESIYHWFNIDASNPSLSFLNYEKISDISLNNGIGHCETEYAMTFRDTVRGNDYKLIAFKTNVKKSEDSEAFWHIHIHTDEDDLFNEYIQIPLETQTMHREIILPNDLKTWYISSYLYNPNNNVIEYSDFEVKYY